MSGEGLIFLGKKFVDLSPVLLEELRTQLQEITTDDILKADVAKEVIWKRAAHLSVGEKVVPALNTKNLEQKLYWADYESVGGEFPVPEDATAARSAAAPWASFDVKMQMAEYRWAITFFAKARQLANSQMQAQMRAGSEFFKRCKDQQILDALYAGAGATAVTVASGKEWDAGSADMDPEKDIVQAWNSIVDESNVGEEEMAAVHLVYPAKIDATLRGLKMIENINQSLMKYLKQSYGFSFHMTRYYDETGATKLQDDALMIVKSVETARHYKYTGGVIPMAHTKTIDRGTEYITRAIFGSIVVPSASGVTTSKRICKIANVI